MAKNSVIKWYCLINLKITNLTDNKIPGVWKSFNH